MQREEYKKAQKGFTRLVDKDSVLRDIVTAPMPNMPLIGAYILLFGVILAPLAGGLPEYAIAAGCLMQMHGGRQMGMEAQPELYVCGGVAIAMIAVAEAAGYKPPDKKKRRTSTAP